MVEDDRARPPGSGVDPDGDTPPGGPQPPEGPTDRTREPPPSGDPPWLDLPPPRSWEGRRDPRRWRLYGCGVLLLLVVVALLVGARVLRTTVWAGYAAVQRRLVASLPHRLPPGERLRTTRNLDRFTRRLGSLEDPYPAMGRFRRRVSEALSDGRVSVEEVAGINRFLEDALAETPSR